MIHSSFTAELHCQYGQIGVVDTPTYVHPLFSLDQDGWLCTEDQRGETPSFRPLRFSFHFIKATDNRIHYAIGGENTWEYFGSRLQKNKNGWLGLYATHILGRIISLPPELLKIAVEGLEQWKIDPQAAWDGNLERADTIPFYLRDQQGHRVSLIKSIYTREKPNRHYWFLNAGEKDGEILTFYLKNIQVS
ncbi:hypothetical protein D3C76_945380 [compost metagenome]